MFEFPQLVQLATSHGLTLLCHNETSRVAIFQYPSDISQWKVNVYYTTQTVATVINHPVKGRTQLFRRNVSLADLGKIFQNARAHTGKGYYRRSDSPLQPNLVTAMEGQDQDDEETALKKQLANLEEQTKVVNELLDVFEQKRRLEEEKRMWEAAEAIRIQWEMAARAEAQRLERERQRQLEEKREQERVRKSVQTQLRRVRGFHVDWSLCFSDGIPSNMNFTKCLALSPSGGYTAVGDDTGCEYFSIPDEARDILDRQHCTNLDYVYFGAKGEYYIQKTNGKTFWNYPGKPDTEFEDDLSSKWVDFMALGQEGSYYIQFRDGQSVWNGIPDELSRILKSRKNRHRNVCSVWLSNEGEGFYVVFDDGACFFQGVTFPQRLYDTLINPNIRVKQLLYIESNRTYVVRYS